MSTRCVTLMLVCSLISGIPTAQASPSDDHYVDPAFGSLGITEAVVLPFVDARQDKSAFTNFRTLIAAKLEPEFARRGYRVVEWTSPDPDAKVDPAGYWSADSSWVRGLPVGDHRWALVPCLENSNVNRSLGSLASVQLSLALFDVKNGTVVWRSRGLGRFAMSGPSGWLTGERVYGKATTYAVKRAIASLPKRH